MQSFDELNLPAPLMKALGQMQFTTPTPIQAQAIPAALEGQDILGSAQTGTGKTGAFGIPLVTRLLTNPRGSALVMTPTRELAVQVEAQLIQMLGKYSPIKTALLIGGESMPKQLNMLRARPRVIVGTPGRINDHLERGNLMLHDTSFLVLDETDRMLDMGFNVQIEKIMKFLPQQRQTLLFSATLPANIVKMSEKYLSNPVRVSVGSTTKLAENIDLDVVHVADENKYPKLLEQLDKREGSIIVFVKTKWGADKMAQRLRKEKHRAEAIHGDLRQSQRDRVISGFRDYKFRILVATDIAARGLDIPHIEHVINYDLPQCPEDYIHRIGRTARAGAKGEAICFVSPADKPKWRAIERMMDPDAKQESGGGPKGGSRGPKHKRHFRAKKPQTGGGNGSSNKPQGSRSSRPGGKKPFRKGPRRNSGGGNSAPQGNRNSSAA